MQWRSSLRHCATSRKVAGSIPDGLGVDSASNRKEYHKYFLWRKGVGLTNLPPSCVDSLEIWELQPPGTLKACPACTGIALPFVVYVINYRHLACHILPIMRSLLAMTAKNQGEAAVSSVGHLHDVGQGQVDTTRQNVRVISRDAYLEFRTCSTNRWSQTLKIAVSDRQ